MSRLAEVDGKRCAGLIYLDAAYDRTDQATIDPALPSPPAPRMHAADAASVAAFRAYAVRVMGVQVPESEIRAASRFDANGRYIGEVASDAWKARVVAAVRQPRYDRIQCRSLAIYATPDSIADVFPYYADFDATARAQADTVLKFVVSLIAISRARLERFPQNEVVEIHGGNHNIFLQRPDEVERAMRAFLSVK
jgi:pimeloyl-ACP methyl ester carboxylesterase